MSFLPLLHQAATAVGTTGLIYTALIVLAALISLLAPSSTRRGDARETLKILLRRKPSASTPIPPAGPAHTQPSARTGQAHDGPRAQALVPFPFPLIPNDQTRNGLLDR